MTFMGSGLRLLQMDTYSRHEVQGCKLSVKSVNSGERHMFLNVIGTVE